MDTVLALLKEYLPYITGPEHLGFPSNEFGGQEPSGNDEVKAFCDMTCGGHLSDVR